jgi:prefoldin alpha subunit
MNDDELRQSMAALDSFKVQLQAMTQQSQYLQISLEETLRARDTLKAFANAKEGDEILVPAGASSFVIATVTSKRKAIVGIGNKTSIDMDLTDAAAYMEDASKEVSEALKKITTTMQEMDSKARSLALNVQQEYQRRQQ